MKQRLIEWTLRWLAWLEYRPAEIIQELREENRLLADELRVFEAQESSRKARSAILRDVINGLIPDVPQIVQTKNSLEWKRHQLFHRAVKRFPRVPQALSAIGADYALYYAEHGHLNMNGNDL